MKKIEASQFKWAKWKNARYAGLEMPTSACGLIDGDFCQRFGWWVLSGEMATSASGLINDVSCLWFDWWWLLLVVGLMVTSVCGSCDGDFY